MNIKPMLFSLSLAIVVAAPQVVHAQSTGYRDSQDTGYDRAVPRDGRDSPQREDSTRTEFRGAGSAGQQAQPRSRPTPSDQPVEHPHRPDERSRAGHEGPQREDSVRTEYRGVPTAPQPAKKAPVQHGARGAAYDKDTREPVIRRQD